MYKIYGTSTCPYCTRATQLLDERGIEYEYTSLDDNDDLRESLTSQYNHYSVPMIVDSAGEFLGGFKELSEKDANGTL